MRELAADEFCLWDEVVEESNEGSLFHQSAWVQTVGRYSGQKPVILGVFKGDALLGGCVLYIRSKYGLLRYAASTVPMSPYGGLCIRPARKTKGGKSMRYMHEICQTLASALESTYPAVELVNAPEFIDLRPFTWNGWRSSVLFTSYLCMDQDRSSAISDELRKALNRARKSGISIRVNRDIPRHYRLLEKTYERQQMKPPVTEEFMEKAMQVVFSKGAGEMWIAETPEGEDAAGNIVVWDRKRAHGWSAVTDPRLRDTHAHSLLLQEIFSYLSGRGFSEFNIMTANIPSIAQFYARYNPVLVPYYKTQKVRRSLEAGISIRGLFGHFGGAHAYK